MRLITTVAATLALTLVSGRVAACTPAGEPTVSVETACMYPVDIVGNDGLCDLVAYVDEDTLVLAKSLYEGDEIAATDPVDVVELDGKVPPGHVIAFHCLRHGRPDPTLVAVAPLSHDLPVNAVAAWEVDFEQQALMATGPEGIVCEMGSGDGEVLEQALDGAWQE